MNEAADAEAEDSNCGCYRNHNREDISCYGPAGKEADQSSSQAEDGNALIELLLFPVFQYIGGALLSQEFRCYLDYRIISKD